MYCATEQLCDAFNIIFRFKEKNRTNCEVGGAVSPNIAFCLSATSIFMIYWFFLYCLSPPPFNKSPFLSDDYSLL